MLSYHCPPPLHCSHTLPSHHHHHYITVTCHHCISPSLVAIVLPSHILITIMLPSHTLITITYHHCVWVTPLPIALPGLHSCLSCDSMLPPVILVPAHHQGVGCGAPQTECVSCHCHTIACHTATCHIAIVLLSVMCHAVACYCLSCWCQKGLGCGAVNRI